MEDLEALHLCLRVHIPDGYMDQNYVKNHAFPRLPKLQRFGCFLESHRRVREDPVDLLMVENTEMI